MALNLTIAERPIVRKSGKTLNQPLNRIHMNTHKATNHRFLAALLLLTSAAVGADVAPSGKNPAAQSAAPADQPAKPVPAKKSYSFTEAMGQSI